MKLSAFRRLSTHRSDARLDSLCVHFSFSLFFFYIYKWRIRTNITKIAKKLLNLMLIFMTHESRPALLAVKSSLQQFNEMMFVLKLL